MKRLCTLVGAVCVVALMTGSALGLEIQLGPRTLVLSSGGDQLTIHTDFPYWAAGSVTLDIGGNSDVPIATWSDDCGNLVARCSKDDVEETVGDFDGKFTTVEVILTVNESDSNSETLRVRK